ncbi:SSD domain-containing protein [Sandaracinus amylolyticus]|nr:SSD domain-containing protein [Sandaracinus amylolyticus]
MFARWLDALAAVVTARRRTVLLLVAMFVTFAAIQLPRLQTDSSPENLLISYGGYADRARVFRESFGDTDSVVAILVEAADATQLEPLRYVHRLSKHLASQDYAVRVESLTVTPLPGARVEAEATLDDLEGLDDLEEPDSADARAEAALQVLVAAEPERFPMGLYSVAERVGDGEADTRAVVQGDEVTEDEATAIRTAIEDLPLVDGRLVSRDRTLAAVVAFLDPALGTGQRRLEAVHRIDAWLAANPPPAGITVHPAGIPHLRAKISDAMLEDQTILVPLSLLVCIALLYASFRWWPGTLLTLATVGASVVSVLGIMALVGEPLTILMNTLPTLLIIMGISEAVHVVARYVEETRRSPDRVAAARRAIRQLAVACFLTSFTTSVGFASLLVAQTEMLRRFGLVASIGVMVSYVILVTFVPAALTFFPTPSEGQVKGEDPLPRGKLEAILVRVTAYVVRHAKAVLVVAVLLTIPCAWAYSAIQVDTSLRDTFDPSDPIVRATQLVDERLDGIRPLEVMIEADEDGALRDPRALETFDRIARWAATQDGVLRTTTPGDFLWETWRRIAGVGRDDARTPFRSPEQVDALLALLDRLERSPVDAYLTDDGRRARIEIRLGDIGAQRSIRLIRAIEQKLEEELAPLHVTYSTFGEAYIGSHGADAVVQDMFGSLSLSALVIFATIALLFRSVKLGLLAIPPNVIPQIATVAWMVARGIPLNASTAIVFSVAIGVSVDLTIHAFARLVEEEERGLWRRAALVRAARGTGRAIVVSCATLVMGFGVLLLSGFVPVRQFGELIAVALSTSLVATLIFQPALMMLVGRLRRPRA